MATSLFSQLMNDFRGDSLSAVATAFGETPGRTEMALGDAAAALIGGLAGKASTPDQATRLLDVMRGSDLDSDRFTDVGSALKAPGGITGLMNIGAPLLESLFGGRVDSIADSMTSRSGVSRSTASSILRMALPIILGMVAKRLRSSGAWNASSLMGLLNEQRSLLPEIPGPAPDVRREHVPAYASSVGYDEPRSKRGSNWLWALPLLLLIPLLGYFMTRGDAPRRAAEVRLPEVRVPEVRVPEVGVPRARIPDPARPVGTTGVTIGGPYRIEFPVGTSQMTSGTANDLREIAAALKANPRARVEVNGYTDNAGDDDANRTLSERRARATMDELVALGVARSRIQAHGYGEDRPVADNATTEGRQRNRRVEIVVTKE